MLIDLSIMGIPVFNPEIFVISYMSEIFVSNIDIEKLSEIKLPDRRKFLDIKIRKNKNSIGKQPNPSPKKKPAKPVVKSKN